VGKQIEPAEQLEQEAVDNLFAQMVSLLEDFSTTN
jgi:hypothetical protein